MPQSAVPQRQFQPTKRNRALKQHDLAKRIVPLKQCVVVNKPITAAHEAVNSRARQQQAEQHGATETCVRKQIQYEGSSRQR